jgi:hypothetical protein
VIFGPLEKGLGVRVGWLGNTGMGKTFAMAWVLDEILAAGLEDAVLIVDDKNDSAPWPGIRRANPGTLADNPPAEDEEAQVVVYRGAAMDPASTVDVNEVATQAWEIARQTSGDGEDEGHPAVMIVVDEMRRAVSPSGREWRAPMVAKTLAEGRAAAGGISIMWGTQAPQRLTVEAFDQSMLCVFKLGHRGRSYLERSDLISAQVSQVIAGLREREFIVIDDAGDWNGLVYEVPYRRRRRAPDDAAE